MFYLLKWGNISSLFSKIETKTNSVKFIYGGTLVLACLMVVVFKKCFNINFNVKSLIWF